MADIQTVWDTTNCVGDYALKDGSLQAGKDVETAILISLFTDRIADINDELPDFNLHTHFYIFCTEIGRHAILSV